MARRGFTVDQSVEEAFDAINNVRGCWSQKIEDDTDKLNAEFRRHYRDAHRSTFRITEFVAETKVVWLVLENYFNFVQAPADECYDVCSNAWGGYIGGSLKGLITKGKGNPNPKEH